MSQAVVLIVIGIFLLTGVIVLAKNGKSIVLAILKTLKKENGDLDTKKCERFAAYNSMLLICIAYMLKRLASDNFTATELMIIVSGWLLYNFGNSKLIQGDKKLDKNPNI